MSEAFSPAIRLTIALSTAIALRSPPSSNSDFESFEEEETAPLAISVRTSLMNDSTTLESLGAPAVSLMKAVSQSPVTHPITAHSKRQRFVRLPAPHPTCMTVVSQHLRT